MEHVTKDCSFVAKIMPTATMIIADPSIPKIVIWYKITLRNTFNLRQTYMYTKLVMDETSTNTFDANNTKPAEVSYNSSLMESELFVP